MMGGIESLLLTIAECGNATPELDHQFALTFDDTFAARLRHLGRKVHLLPQVRLRYLPSIRRSRYQLRTLLQESSFDVVIAHSSWIQLIFADVVRRRSVPRVLWMHGPFDGHWLQKLASFQQPDFVICNSQWTRSTLDRCYPRVRGLVIYAPVPARRDKSDLAQVRNSLAIQSDEVVILIAARMESWKGHFVLLDALSDMKSSVPWKLLVAGAPNSARERAYFESLQHRSAAPELRGRVQFLGYRSDVSALLSVTDIYCQPNRKPEPFGVVYVEALHAGVPVVTSAIGGAREILDRGTAIFVEPGDRSSLTRALSQLIDDREERTRLGNAGPPRARVLCDPGQQMQKLSETLQSVVGRKKAGSL